MNLRRLNAVVVVALLLSLIPLGAGAAESSEFNLTAIARTSPDVVRPGDALTFTFEASGPGELDSIDLTFEDSIGRERNARAGDEGFDRVVTDAWLNGPHELTEVTTYWRVDNGWFLKSYYRDGTSDGDGSHTLDFEALDFTVEGASADVTVPELQSISVLNESVLGLDDDLQIAFDVADDAPIDFVDMMFTDPAGRVRWLWDTAPEAHGTLSQAVGKNWRSGDYVLDTVYVWSQNDLGIVYYGDGTVERFPDGASGPTANNLSFDEVTFTVDNPGGDFVGPELTGVSSGDSHTYFPGERLEFDYTASDPSGVDAVGFLFTTQDQVWKWATKWSDDPDGLDGHIDVSMNSWSVGHYELAAVSLRDLADNFSRYLRDGSIEEEYEATGETHSLDFSGLDLDVVAWPYTFESEGDLGTLQIDFASGKFRMTQDGWWSTPVMTSEITSLPGGLFAATFNDADFSLEGTFDPATGRFQATVRDGVGVTPLGSANLPAPLPIP
ncbi:MAG: hypothetical protein QOG54_2160 [Actinomycetota bacterium]|jgi:hypothetical protein|nr:hypothetical protein [Actinomycetota bacterium]